MSRRDLSKKKSTLFHLFVPKLLVRFFFLLLFAIFRATDLINGIKIDAIPKGPVKSNLIEKKITCSWYIWKKKEPQQKNIQTIHGFRILYIFVSVLHTIILLHPFYSIPKCEFVRKQTNTQQCVYCGTWNSLYSHVWWFCSVVCDKNLIC